MCALLLDERAQEVRHTHQHKKLLLLGARLAHPWSKPRERGVSGETRPHPCPTWLPCVHGPYHVQHGLSRTRDSSHVPRGCRVYVAPTMFNMDFHGHATPATFHMARVCTWPQPRSTWTFTYTRLQPCSTWLACVRTPTVSNMEFHVYVAPAHVYVAPVCTWHRPRATWEAAYTWLRPRHTWEGTVPNASLLY